MNELNCEMFRGSLDSLKSTHDHYLSVKGSNEPDIAKKMGRFASVHYFEKTRDSLCRHFKKFLEHQGFELPMLPVKIYITAYDNGYVDEGMKNRLIECNKINLEAEHDYTPEETENTLTKIGTFIHDAEKIYAIMSTEK